MSCRLAILGWGPERDSLEALSAELNISDYVALLGYAENPYQYMSRANIFVLSSAWEGLSIVLIEALALGIPAVSTDCRSGPREILADGQIGQLVPVGDVASLAQAMRKALNEKPPSIPSNWLDQFKLETSVKQYLSLL
jgi:glycosyltransferase involved in cell wall biosynthesis